VLVTAGPTYEPIDAVRFIGNYSSGKMGYSIAEVLAENGVHVILVSGPTSLKIHHPNVDLYPVKTASEMLTACLDFFPETNGAILSAAVADFRPLSPVTHKIKRKDEHLSLELEPNADIAATLGKMKRSDQFLAGFALETENGITNAGEKLKRKNFDFIVLNSLEDEGSGFNSDTNKITIIDKNNKIIPFELKAKYEVALDIVSYLDKLLQT
jgi:phosphopantothenoylcysteine decarboxylase/phosphopantothenate--cysteine ligase